MQVVDRIAGLVEPIEFTIDIERLRKVCDRVLNTIVFSDAAQRAEVLERGPFGTVNLTHLPGLQKQERWFKHSGGHLEVLAEGVDEADFTVVNRNLVGTYMHEVMRRVENRHLEIHGTPFAGRCQLIWVNPGSCYALHVDKHTPHRYHIPIETNPEALWVFREQQDVTLLHMPADGRVWYLNPIQQQHSVANMGSTPRYHLLMTSGV